MIPLSDDIRSRRFPLVTVAIIIACVVVFIQELLNPTAWERWAFKPAYLLSRELLAVGPLFALQTMLVSVFLHGGWLHIGGNMLFLWVFGDNVEDRLGHFRFLVFYLVSGVAATLVHSASAVFGLPHDPNSLQRGVVGASGAIAGVLGAYLVLFPRSYIRALMVFFFITIINVPATFFIILWFIMQLFSGVGTLAGVGSGVAYWAHIGGFVVGYLWARRLSLPRRRGPQPRVLRIDVDDL